MLWSLSTRFLTNAFQQFCFPPATQILHSLLCRCQSALRGSHRTSPGPLPQSGLMFRLFFFSLSPAFLPRACPGFPGIPPLCLSCVLFPCPSCLLPSTLLSCLLLLSNSLRSPPLLPARTVSSLCSLSACPSGSALLVLLPLFPGFCFFLPLPLPSCLPCAFGFLQRSCQKNAESSSRVICIFVCFRKYCPQQGQFLDDLELL